eukprot:scaffold665494_cov50-Prasinocladus_malaysianus.AAC.1
MTPQASGWRAHVGLMFVHRRAPDLSWKGLPLCHAMPCHACPVLSLNSLCTVKSARFYAPSTQQGLLPRVSVYMGLKLSKSEGWRDGNRSFTTRAAGLYSPSCG